eukprot:5729227-Prymnesium_polylepis.1
MCIRDRLMRAMKGTRGDSGASCARKSGSSHGSIHDVSCGATGARLNVSPALALAWRSPAAHLCVLNPAVIAATG